MSSQNIFYAITFVRGTEGVCAAFDYKKKRLATVHKTLYHVEKYCEINVDLSSKKKNHPIYLLK